MRKNKGRMGLCPVCKQRAFLYPYKCGRCDPSGPMSRRKKGKS